MVEIEKLLQQLSSVSSFSAKSLQGYKEYYHMPVRKTGTVTGASLEKSNRGKKGGLTGSRRVTGETATPIAETSAETVLEAPTESTAQPTPASVVEKLQEIASGTASAIEKGANAVSTVQRYTSKIAQTVQGTDQDRNPSALTDGKVNTSEILAKASADIDENIPQLDSGTATLTLFCHFPGRRSL